MQADLNQNQGQKASPQRRLTKQRKIILEELIKLTTHPTADELYQIVRKRMPSISLGTVYRNLDFLVAQGQIAKLETGGGQKRFDALLDFHQHVRCIKCGRIADVFSPLPVPDVAGLEVSGFKVISSRVELDGLCDDCASQGLPC